MRTCTRLLLLIMFSAGMGFSQVDSVYTGSPPDETKKIRKEPRNFKWKEKVSWGGNFQAWVGNPTFVFLSPTLGYFPFKNFNVGIGGIYNYTSYRSRFGSYAQSIFGGHSYMRYIIAESYFVQVQADKLYQPDIYSLDPRAKRWVNYYLIGGGLRQSIGEKAALITSIMYELKPDPLSIYPSRIVVQFGIVGNF